MAGSALRIVCLSDTHGHHAALDVPPGDLLVHAGDFTKRGTEAQVADFAAFLAELPHPHKLVVSGNHDFLFEREPERARGLIAHESVTYLEHGFVELAGLRIFGSPWQPWFHDWAFNLRRGEELRAKWAEVPDELDLLITHSPPHGVLDRVWTGEPVGCEELRAALPRIAPRLHVFGHIHEAYGQKELRELPGTRFVNASNCDLGYRPTQPPVVVELAPRGA